MALLGGFLFLAQRPQISVLNRGAILSERVLDSNLTLSEGKKVAPVHLNVPPITECARERPF